MNAVMYTILNQIRSISVLLHPIMPDSFEKILNAMGILKKDIKLEKLMDTKFLKSGTTIKKTNI